MAYEEYDYYNEPIGESKSLKESLYEILNGFRSEKNLKETGEGLTRLRQSLPGVTESVARGAIAAVPGSIGDISDFARTYAPEVMEKKFGKERFFPTTREILDYVPRMTPTHEGANTLEDVASLISPGIGGVTKDLALLTKDMPIGNMIAYHGTKHDITGPLNVSKVGSEGGANYGHGLYTAEHPAVAQPFGKNLYKLDIPDEHIEKMIHWDNPLSEQTKHVQKVLKELDPTIPPDATGREIYQRYSKAINLEKNAEIEQILKENPDFNVPAAASHYLNANDIKGITYENFQAQKGQGFGTQNYVVFDPTDTRILAKNGQKLASDIDELGFHSPLENAILKIQQPKGTGDQFLKQLEKTPGVKTEELDVSGVKQYLLDHPNVTKQELLDYMGSNRLKLEQKVLGESTGEGNTYEDYQLRGGEVYHDDDYIQGLADDLHYDMKNDDVIRSQEREALLEADPERYADYEINPSAAERLEKDIDGVLYENAKQQANDMYYENPISHYYDDHGYEIYGNDEMGYSFKDPNGRFLDIGGRNGTYDLSDAESNLRSHLLDEGILSLDDEGAAKFEDYTLPGKYTNYREVLTTLPDKHKLSDKDWYYKSHYDEPNILVHTRVNDRNINGKKTLFVEEIQSDWHQAGRKSGYESEAAPFKQEYEQKLEDWRNFIKEEATKMNLNVESLNKLSESTLDSFATNEMYHLMDQPTIDRMNEIFAAKNEAWREYKNKLSTNVPEAPFKKNWQELQVKQLLDMAAKGDYDAIAFTTGKQQVERYENSLRQAVDKIEFSKGYPPGTITVQGVKGGRNTFEGTVENGKFINGPGRGKTIEEVLGKGLAKQIDEHPGGELGVIEGKDLTIGGEAMKTFYDEMIPYFINKYGKKWGMKVKKEHLTPPDNDRFMNFKDWANQKDPGLNDTFLKHSWANQDDLYKEFINTDRKGDEVNYVDLSDMAKKDIKSKGQPLFSGIGLAAPALMPEDQDKTKK